MMVLGDSKGLVPGKSVVHGVVNDLNSQWTLRMPKINVNGSKFTTNALYAVANVGSQQILMTRPDYETLLPQI